MPKIPAIGKDTLPHRRTLLDNLLLGSYREDRVWPIILAMKRLVFLVLYLLGVAALFRHIHRKSLTIVLYHGVAPTPPRDPKSIFNYRGKFVSPTQFRHQLAYFKKHYVVMPLDVALDQLAAGTLPERALVITFDDGYANFHEHALPALRDTDMTATMFVATDFVVRRVPLWVDRLEYACGKRNGTFAERIAFDARTRDELKALTPEAREERLTQVEGAVLSVFRDFAGDRAVYAPLTQEQIRDCLAAGMTFGAHTRSHPILSMMPGLAQQNEIEGSRTDLEAWGVPVSPTFAYPNGHETDWNLHTLAVLSHAGFTRSLTTIEGTSSASTPPYRLHRMVLDATSDIATVANIVSGVRLWLHRFR
ncbi:hypothetical protein FJY94_06370 [Candidatus Kaiserbacteria bacterium]|nr:hypothetical protein [Candidatus Kaiserbacteria bacterium]